MSATEEITLHTFPKKHNAKRRFVTGLTNNEGTIWENCSQYKYGDRHPSHSPPLEDLTIEVPAAFGNRLFSFYRRFLGSEEPTGLYNCHSFGLWMIGSKQAELDAFVSNDTAEIQRVMTTGRMTVGGLQLGQLGVIGYIDSYNVFPFHSVVGFCEQTETTQIIQVAGLGGKLTVSSCADALDRYYGEGLPSGALYTIDAALPS